MSRETLAWVVLLSAALVAVSVVYFARQIGSAAEAFRDTNTNIDEIQGSPLGRLLSS